MEKHVTSTGAACATQCACTTAPSIYTNTPSANSALTSWDQTGNTENKLPFLNDFKLL